MVFFFFEKMKNQERECVYLYICVCDYIYGAWHEKRLESTECQYFSCFGSVGWLEGGGV